MVSRRHARSVGIPVKDIERHRLFAAHVVVDDVRPDQIVGSQHVEGVGHARGLEVALFLHVRFELLDAFFIDEHHQVAGKGEIDLCREKRRRFHAILFFCRKIGEGDRK